MKATIHSLFKLAIFGLLSATGWVQGPSSAADGSGVIAERFQEIDCRDCTRKNPLWTAFERWDPAHGLGVGRPGKGGTLIAIGRITKGGGPKYLPPLIAQYQNGELSLSAVQLEGSGLVEGNGNHANSILIADLDGDGTEEIFSANAGIDRPPYPGQLNTIWKQTAVGWNLVPIEGQPTTFNHYAAVVGSPSAPSANEIVVALSDMSSNRETYLNYSIRFESGKFVATRNRIDPQINMTSLAASDINGDGLVDVVYGSYEQGERVWSGSGLLIQAPNGSFTHTKFPRPKGEKVHSSGLPATGDIDGDGLVDVVLPNTPAWPSKERYRRPILQVLKQEKDGTWTDQTETILKPHPQFDWSDSYVSKVFLSDLDQDGRKDLVMEVSEKRWESRRAWLRVFRNRGGVLVEEQLFLGQDQSRITIADVDGDGKDDIVVSRSSGLKVLRQR